VRHAAVVVPIVAGPEPAVLFIRRAGHLRRNAGQIAFPGGLVDESDAGDLRQTALREFEEELGVAAGAVDVVGRLPDTLVINRTVLISPFVGVLETLPAMRIDASEVDEAFGVPLSRIVEPGALHEGIEVFGGFRIPTWQLDVDGVHIWGATARILRSLLDAAYDDGALRDRLAAYGIGLRMPGPNV
jgi:8-oxo-dGTP pyrophosphatase MutT (NUDIX family)